MLLSKLIAELQEALSIYGDIGTCVYADHGQRSMTISLVSTINVPKSEANEYMKEAVHEDDMYEDEEYVQFIEICA